MTMTKVTKKGQITIPGHLRDKFDIYTGTLVNVVEEDNKIIIKKMKSKNSFFGIWKDEEFDFDIIKKGWKSWNEKKSVH